ncbi:hypothetical protein P154DRAFT_413852, partial [Amniculicola lignicola CBS 123094]
SFVSSRLSTSIRPSGLCTQDISEGVCCDLYQAAEPCQDECRKTWVDRETMRLTKEWDVCQEKCLMAYEGTCGDGKEKESQ